jgi:6-phosphofructokinase 2
MKRIVTLTLNPSVDVYGKVDELRPWYKLRCSDVRRDPGGGGINVARAIHHLGGEATALYLAGGPTGDQLQELLNKELLEGIRVLTVNTTRESFVIVETSTGLEYRYVLPGQQVSELEWRECLDILSGLRPAPDFIVASGSMPAGSPVDFYARVARLARKMGALMVLDTSGDALKAALEEKVFLLKPNRRELGGLLGGCLEEEQIEEVARKMVADGKCDILALTLGADGALLAWDERTFRIQPPEVKVVSSVGAGDSFLGGFVLKLAKGDPLMEAFRFGVAAGTAALLTPGTELCGLKDTWRLYREMESGTGTSPLDKWEFRLR